MWTERSLRRRALLLGVVAGIGGIVGCLDATDEDAPPATPTPTPDTPTPTPAGEATPTPDPVEVVHEEVVSGLNHPWALEPIPNDERLFVTERSGELSIVDPVDGSIEQMEGIPSVHARGQGGLLDVALDPTFPNDPWLYLTYVATNDDGDASATHVGRGAFDLDAGVIEDFEVLFAVEPFVDVNAHYGSRVVIGPDDMVYVTSGDRQFKEFGPDHVAQDTSNTIGTTVRLAPDGSIPADNPFVDDPDVHDAIFSFGHRNAQGMTVRPGTGAIWQSEHGEEDGDELNVIEAGGNYGWPVAHTGCRYGTDDPIGDDPHERDDIVDPVYYWPCASGGFPPAGMTFYTGDAIPQWRGDLFVGNLAGRYLGHFSVTGEYPDEVEVAEVDPLLADEGWRIRDVAVAPDSGDLYVAIDDTDAPIVRFTAA